MKGFRIKIGDEWIADSRLHGAFLANVAGEHERKAIAFCQSWLTDKNVFEFHTSGSTGPPKKITFKKDQLIASAGVTAMALHLKPGDTSLVCLDTDFIAGAMMLVRGMVVGMDMIIKAPSADPLENITEHIDFTALVPYQVMNLLKSEPEKLNSISKVIIGGAPLNQETIQSLQLSTSAFYATYGMTETISHIALQKLNGSDRQDYFQVLPGIEGSIDIRGCLVINAPHISDNPIVTNDIVSFVDNDKFHWLGRYDRVINSGGVKVSPEKIEKALEVIFSRLEIKNRFFVDSLPDQKLGQQIVLVVEGHLDKTAGERITTQLKNSLDKYEMPKKILHVSTFIQTSSQKIDRNATLTLQAK